MCVHTKTAHTQPLALLILTPEYTIFTGDAQNTGSKTWSMVASVTAAEIRCMDKSNRELLHYTH